MVCGFIYYTQLGKNYMASKIKKSEYQNYADCIRSDQVSAPEIVELFEDKAFYKWYKKKYLNDTSRP
mgnify:CR=1 FL=1